MLEDKLKEYINKYHSDISVCINVYGSKKKIYINEDKKYRAASTLNIIIASLLFREVERGLISLNEKVKISENEKYLNKETLNMIYNNEYITVVEILKLMIASTDDSITNIVIDLLGFYNINDFISTLRLKNTVLNRKMMDIGAAKKGEENYTTAFDLVYILNKLHHNELISEKASKTIKSIMLKQNDKAMELLLDKDVQVMHKTGTLKNLKHDYGLIYDNDLKYALCVLTDNNEDDNVGTDIIKSISKIVYDYLKEK